MFVGRFGVSAKSRWPLVHQTHLVAAVQNTPQCMRAHRLGWALRYSNLFTNHVNSGDEFPPRVAADDDVGKTLLSWCPVYWIFPSCAVAGVGLGLRNKPAALAAGSVFILVSLFFAAIIMGWGLIGGVTTIFGSLICFQAGYVAGAMIAHR